MAVKAYLTSVLMPPVGACRYGCGSSCAAPVTVFWLFGLVSVVYGFFGGPMGSEDVSWYTIALGAAMWLVAAVWALLTITDVEQNRCQDVFVAKSGNPENKDGAARS